MRAQFFFNIWLPATDNLRMPKGLTWTLPPVLPVNNIPALLPPPAAAADIEMELRVSVCRSISRSNTDSQISFIVLSFVGALTLDVCNWLGCRGCY